MNVTGSAFVIGGLYPKVPAVAHILIDHRILASGIGRSCALAFAKYGVGSLTLGDINSESAQKVVQECQAIATNPDFTAQGIHIDVTLEDSVRTAMRHAVSTFGRIDHCVNSAGVSFAASAWHAIDSFKLT